MRFLVTLYIIQSSPYFSSVFSFIGSESLAKRRNMNKINFYVLIRETSKLSRTRGMMQVLPEPPMQKKNRILNLLNFLYVFQL